MEAIFGGNLATGKFAMASNEPLGTPTDIGLDATEDLTDLGGTDADSGRGTPSVNGKQPSDGKGKEERGPKRRKMAQEELELMNGMIKAVEHVGDALKAPQHNEVHEDLYGCVMNCPEYSQEALMFALVYLLKNKAESLCFAQMIEAHRIL
jgi:hypothetical protein